LDENGFPRFVVNRHATVDDVSNAANEHADETITMALDETGAWRATNSTAQ
jgi:hypothetical protein